MKRFKTVDDFIDGLDEWSDEVIQLRKLLNTTALDETVKWGFPTYTSAGKNLVGIGAFKSYFGLWFFQGALLTDPGKFLINAQDGKTKAMRQWRMTSSKDIKVRAIKAYVKEAIALSARGQEIKADRSKPVVVSDLLVSKFNRSKKLQTAFNKFTKGKQREFTEYIESAKRAETKQRRLEKILPMILDGVGLNDKYR